MNFDVKALVYSVSFTFFLFGIDLIKEAGKWKVERPDRCIIWVLIGIQLLLLPLELIVSEILTYGSVFCALVVARVLEFDFILYLLIVKILGQFRTVDKDDSEKTNDYVIEYSIVIFLVYAFSPLKVVIVFSILYLNQL